MRQPRALHSLLVVLAILSAALFLGGVSPAYADATPCADLSITAIDVNPAQPVAGLPATISITVHNGGTCAAPGFVVQWRQDVFALTGPSKSVASLGAGESSTVVVSSDFTYPAPGNYLSVAQVDTGNAVSETNEVNNLEIRSITVVPATRNLTITNFQITPDPVVRGRTATASITVKNTGNSPTGQFRVEWSPFVFSVPLSRQVAGLGPGASTVVTMDYTYPFDGTVFTTATVDTTGMVDETNEFDNQASKLLVVEPPLPDLEVTAVNVTSSAVAGQPTTVNVTVANTGNDPAGAFVVRWQPWLFGPPLAEQVNGLAVGATATVTFTYTFPFAATFDGTVTADSTNVVPEVSESNNTKDTHISVAEAGIDLTITDLHIECGREQCSGNPVQGEPITAVITVKNLGNAPSGSFVTEWNPDTFDIIPQGPHTVSQETGPLGPGESREIRLLYTYPLAGNFRTIAHVDAFDAVHETNETNNLRILNLTVDPAPIDLVIDSFNVPANPVRGVPTTATITVRNAGPIATGSFFVQWKPTPNELFPPLAFVNGLNPGETRTVSLQATYFDLGTFTTTATVDVFNQVVEPFGEGNNTVTKTVTVVPQQTTLDVTLTQVHVINDGDDSLFQGTDAEWEQIFAVFKPGVGAHCSVSDFGQSIDVPDVACQFFRQDGVNSGDTLVDNRTIRVTLVEGTPLAVGYVAWDRDNSVIGPDFPDVRGFTFLLSFRPDYLSLGTQVLKGQGCTDNDGYCFDASVKVTLVSTNVPPGFGPVGGGAQAPTADTFRDEFVTPLTGTG